MMSLGMEVGLGHTVLDGYSTPPPKKKLEGTAPSHFSAHICCGQRAGWIKMPLGTMVGLGPTTLC